MSRKTKTVVIDQPGRDQGNMYVIHEMSARQAEEWGERAMLALARSASESLASVGQTDLAALGSGMAGVAAIGVGLFGRLRWEEAKPLLDELFDQVSLVFDPKKPATVRGSRGDGSYYVSMGPMVETDIEEVATRLLLRKELFELHTGFSIAAVISGFLTTMTAASSLPNTSTSP